MARAHTVDGFTMASRHSVDLQYNPRRFSDAMLNYEDLPLHYGRSMLATPEGHSPKGFAERTFGKSGAESGRRRSFHGGELKREFDRKSKASAPVNVVGLGCWPPSQSKGSLKGVKQHAHHQQMSCNSAQEPLIALSGGDDPSYTHGFENTGVHQLKAEPHPLQSSSDAVENLKEKESNSPMVFVCPCPQGVTHNPLPNSLANYRPPADAYQRLAPHIQHSTTDKSRRRQQQGVKDVQIAIHRLSSRLKRMDLDEVLVPATLQELAADKRGVPVAHKERIEEFGKVNLEPRRSIQEEAQDTHGMGFAESRTGRVHSRHGVRRRKKRHHGPSEHMQSHTLLSRYMEDTVKHDDKGRQADGLSHIHPAQEDIHAPLARFIHAGSPDPADMGLIELEIISSPRKQGRDTDIPALVQGPSGDHATLASQSISQPDAAGSSSSDRVFINPDSNTADSLCLADIPALGQAPDADHATRASDIPALGQVPTNSDHATRASDIPALGQVPTNSDHATRASHSISHSGAAGSSSNTAISLCLSELLLSSSDVCSPSSEDSSQLSEALQHLSGSQALKETNTEAESSQGQQAKQSRDQASQTLGMQERGGCDEDAQLVSFSCTDSSSHLPTSSDRERALLWIHEKDEASQKSAIYVDPTLVLTRFGNLLLNSVPCEGMQMAALEPLFHETIRIARSFLRVLASYVFELGKEIFSEERYDQQRDDEVSLVRIAFLPNICFAHRHHIKYGVQAFINALIFDQFDESSYCGVNRRTDCWVFLVEFQRLATLAPIDAISPFGESYDRCFHSFCSKKLQLVKNKLPWLNTWPDHLLQAFLDAMKYVWQAHLIALASSLDAICLLRVNEWTPYDSSVMEVVDYDYDAAEFISKVHFMLSPGFKLQGSIVKSQVYLMPKTQPIGRMRGH